MINGIEIAEIMKTIKDKNQMSESFESYFGTQYRVSSFNTNIDGNNYVVANYKEVSPNWKDSGPKGDYLNSISVFDEKNIKIVEISFTSGDDPSIIIKPNNEILNLINLNQLKNTVNNLDELPPKEKLAVIDNIKSIRENSNPNQNHKSFSFDLK